MRLKKTIKKLITLKIYPEIIHLYVKYFSLWTIIATRRNITRKRIYIYNQAVENIRSRERKK